jgi:sulfide:quinone oxidoreductase
MARVLILGGGFGGVVVAERLATQFSEEHQITLVSRSRNFVFYPALVRLAFGKCEPEDVSFDLRHAMLNRGINFVEAEVGRIDPFQRNVTIAHGDVEGKLGYDYLVFALGRRLATERIPGFFEHAHHLLNVDKAINFGKAIRTFREGRAVFGQCHGSRLPVPVYESAFALARLLKEKGQRKSVRITVVSPSTIESEFEDLNAAVTLRNAFEAHEIEFLPAVNINSLTEDSAITTGGNRINFNLLMLVPPFQGSSAASHLKITNAEGYINVDRTMRVIGQERMYAVGDCVNLDGPKMGHMAVRQAEVAATNLAAEIDGHEPVSHYQHEMRLVIDGVGNDSVYLHKHLWTDGSSTVRQGRFWSWAKRAQKRYWEVSYS